MWSVNYKPQFVTAFFKMLIGVSGIGPKTAIVLLSSVTPDEFKWRLIAGEVAMLTALPGIGPKTARRIIVELKGKFVKLWGRVMTICQISTKMTEQAIFERNKAPAAFSGKVQP